MSARQNIIPGLYISYKIKLAFAIVIIVTAVSTATLFLTQIKVNENYQHFVSNLFQQQVELFFDKRQTRLSAARDAIEDATTNVRLIAALNANDIDRFYSDLAFELTKIVERYTSNDSHLKPLFRFIDTDGNYISPKSNNAGYLMGIPESNLSQVFKDMLTNASDDNTDNVGYLNFTIMEKKHLFEILIMPIFDPGTFSHIGDLVFAAPVNSISNILGVSTQSMKSGLYLDGEFYSDTIPEEYQDNICKESKNVIKGIISKPPKVLIDKIPHLIFTKSLGENSQLRDFYQVSLFSLDELQLLLKKIRSTVILFTVIALATAIGLSLVTSHNMTKPILNLVSGTKEVKKGNFDIPVPVTSNDELGVLTHSFNEMTSELAIKEKMRSVLDKITDPDVQEELLKGKMKLGGEDRDLTILFCDIRGFTSLTEGMAPTDVIQMLNEHMTAMKKEVSKYNGVVDKFVGDEIMAIFGAPKSYGNDALNAAQCALSMMQARKKLDESGKYKIKIGIGLASGKVVAGNMGSDDRQSYTVLGARVNLAARLCSAAKPMDILIDDLTCERIENKIKTDPIVDLKLKGFSSQIVAYKLTC